MRPSLSVLAIKPLPFHVHPVLAEGKPTLQDVVYIEQSVGIQRAVDVLLACNQYGSYYQERMPEGWRAIGCQEAFRLGELPAHLYEPLPELATGWFTVYRCLSQPGRFLLLPKSYCITRYPPEHAAAYLPAAMVYAVLDADQPDHNRYRFVASLEPDVPAFALRALRATLTTYAAAESIVIDLPADVAASTDLPSMPLAAAIASPQFTVASGGVQIVLETDLHDAVVLRTALQAVGILGRLEFTLTDGARLASDIDMSLHRIVGPWRVGPIAITPGSAGLRLTNRVERAIDVAEVRLYQSTAAFTSLPVGQRIESGASLEIDADPAITVADACAVYSVPPTGPRRSRKVESTSRMSKPMSSSRAASTLRLAE